MSDIKTDLIKVGDLNAYLSRPSGGSTVAMLLLPMITGLGEQLRAYADDIAATGVTALAWDPWHGPTGDDHTHEQLRDLMGRLNDEQALAEQRALLDHLFGELGQEKVGVIGWCLGGRYAFVLAGQDQRLANCVAYHPTVPATPTEKQPEDAVALAEKITCPVTMIYPGADHLVPVETFNALRKALNKRDAAPSIVHVYPGAGHGFMEAHRQDNEINRAATKLSWPQTLSFINTTLS